MTRQISQKRLGISTAQLWRASYDLTLVKETMKVVRWRQRLSDLVSVLTVIGTNIEVDVAVDVDSDLPIDSGIYSCIIV